MEKRGGGGLKVGRGGLKGELYGILKERQETKDVSQSCHWEKRIVPGSVK